MDLKKKFRAFFTLSRSNGGFTLVELIVVIAVLAILGGVAVPAYSGYVKKANMQADRTLISEIEHALTLAGYSGIFSNGESVYIILSAEGVENDIVDGSSLDLALENSFGSDYAEMLKLSFDNWGSSGLIDSLSPGKAFVVKNSSYMSDSLKGDLLSDVEKMTNMAVNLAAALGNPNVSGDLNAITISSLFGESVLNETAAKYGIKKGENEDWEAWSRKSEDNATAYSNLLVLAAADESEKKASDPDYQMSQASDTIQKFASYYAYAAINPEFSDTLDDYMDKLGTLQTSTEAATWYGNLKQAAADAGFYKDYNYDEDGTPNAGVTYQMDAYAFSNLLAGIGNPTVEQADSIAADLSNKNLFTAGAVNEMYNEYLNAVDAMAGLYDVENDVEGEYPVVREGGIVIMLYQNGTEPIIVNSMPKS